MCQGGKDSTLSEKRKEDGRRDCVRGDQEDRNFD